MLVIMENFIRWERTEGWEAMSFSERNDSYIEKLAIFGDDRWHDLIYAFTAKGLRPVPIGFFEAAA